MTTIRIKFLVGFITNLVIVGLFEAGIGLAILVMLDRLYILIPYAIVIDSGMLLIANGFWWLVRSQSIEMDLLRPLRSFFTNVLGINHAVRSRSSVTCIVYQVE